MADYAQPGAVTRRVRFFDGQFLVDQDFIDEQKYHLDRERRLGKVLRITGIAEGMRVTSPGPNKVRVASGTAIDRDGRQLVLAQDRDIDLPAASFNDKTGIQVLALYRELETDLATTGSQSERRWLEEPQVVAVATTGQTTEKIWNDNLPRVVLASLRLDNKGTVTIDGTVAQQAGVRLPGSAGIGTTEPGDFRLNVNGRTRLGGAEYGSAAVLSVSPGTIHFDGPGVVGGRFVLDGTTGNIGIGTTDTATYKLNVNGRSRLGGVTDYGSETVLSVAPGTIVFDAPGVVGGRFVVDAANGRVGVGAPSPRTGLDTGKGVLSGAANDYIKGQFTMSGGGTVTWEGSGGRLKWTKRFIAISAESGSTFASGYFDINMPTRPVPAANVHDGGERPADANGVVLKDWEALYAVHTIGGNYTQLDSFQIRHYTRPFHAPSNWILVAVVNGDDATVKLGTGVILAARSSSSNGSPLPTGTIVMWSGAANAIPTGWTLCNGSGGAPDLRSRFVVGAGAGGSPEYAPDSKGDPDQHTHVIPVPSTAVTTANAGDHNHAPPAAWYDRGLAGGGGAILDYYNSIDRGGGSVRDARTTTSGSHSHSLTVKVAAFDSNASAGNNRPKWYALCFIMKL